MTSEVSCGGIVIQVGPPGMSHDRAKRLARRVVNRRLRGKWRIRALSKRARDFYVRRASGNTIALRQAWDLAAKLAADREVASAEPAFRTTGLEPERAAEELARHEQRSLPKSFGGGRHKPGSEKPLWSLHECKVIRAWDLTPKPGGKRFGQGVEIAHPDTGYTRHGEIWNPLPGRRRVLPDKGYNFEDEKKDPGDPLDGLNPGHGTSTASVIMSDHNPQPGPDPDPWVSGVAPRARLIPFRVSDAVVHFDFANLTEAIYLAVDRGAQVISMSLGGPFSSDFLERAIEEAVREGVILLAAAGNVWPWVVYPAKYENVIAVAAVNCDRKPWKNSASGKAVDLSAPGESVWRAKTVKSKPGQIFAVDRSSGTSYAVATAAGAAALWLAFHGRKKLINKYGKGNLSAIFREVLLEHGFDRPAGWKSKKYGVGILNVEKLLAADLPDGVPAAGMAPKSLRAARARPDRMRLMADYLPEADASRLRTSLTKLLGVGGDELDDVVDLHGDELIFHIATNPKLREKLHDSTKKSAPKRASLRRGLSGNEQFVKRASSALRALAKL